MLDLERLTLTEILRLQTQLQQALARRFERPLLLVFSDIVGSTPYFARFGDAMGRQLHQLHLDLIEQSIAGLAGRLVDAVGDGAFFTFPQAEAGVRGVMALRHAIAAENASRARVHQLALRIGLHWGTVLTDGQSVTGDAVHVAARVGRAAGPGAVVLTRQVFQELGPDLRVHCRTAGTHTLKGLAEPVEMLSLDWRDPSAFPRRVVVEETGQVFELPQQDIVSFGRLEEHDGARANDVVLHHPDPAQARQISRWHFELRRVGEELVLRTLSDSSTTVDDQPVGRGAVVPVRSGTCIRVGDTLTLRLAGLRGDESDEASSRTMLLQPRR